MMGAILRMFLRSNRNDRTRLLLMMIGTALGAGFFLSAMVVAAIDATNEVLVAREDGMVEQHFEPVGLYTSNLLEEPGLRPGVVTALLLLMIPVLVFIGQCTRIGVAERDRRLATLRMVGATPRQVRKITALETGLTCAVGSVVGLVGFLLLRAWLEARHEPGTPRSLPTEVPLPLLPTVLIVTAIPVLGAGAAVVALRRVITNPLEVTRQHRTRSPQAWPVLFLIVGIGVVMLPLPLTTAGLIDDDLLVGLLFLGVLLIVIGLLCSAVWLNARIARVLAGRTSSPSLLIAARRMEADPYGQTRALSAVLLCVLFASGAEVMRRVALNESQDHYFVNPAYNLVDLAIGVALGVAAAGLLVVNVEGIIERRRSLAMLVGVGTPMRTLRRAVLAQTILPAIPSLLITSACSTVAAMGFIGSADAAPEIPFLRLVAILVIALAALIVTTALTLPLLSKAVRPAELHHE